MAQVVTTRRIDDLDGSDAVANVEFGLDGKRHEIDLSETNRERLLSVIKPFQAAARRVGGGSARGRVAPPAAVAPVRRRPTGLNPEQTRAVREWAKKQGLKVAVRGRIAADVQEAFDKAHGPATSDTSS